MNISWFAARARLLVGWNAACTSVAVTALVLVLAACTDRVGNEPEPEDAPAAPPDAGNTSDEPSAGSGGAGGGTGGTPGGAVGDAGATLTAGAPATLDDAIPPVAWLLLDAARNGGAVDLNGDGSIDITFRIVGDTRLVFVPNEDKPELMVTRHPNGDAEKSGDFDLDGRSDFTEAEIWTESSSWRQAEYDANFDGHFESRETWELDLTNGSSHLLVENRAVGETEWTSVDERTESAIALAGSGVCDGLENYPPPGQTDDQTVIGAIRIATAAPSKALTGACSASETVRIRSEIGNLFRNSFEELSSLEDIRDSSAIQCLARRSSAFVEELVRTITDGPGARIGCGGACTGVYGATKVGSSRINLNFSEIHSAAELRGTLLHELIHAAGRNHASAGTDDSIYACERWCTGNSFDADGDLNMNDCFRCSASLAAKQECCGELTVCVGGCCAGPCGPDGTCGACGTAIANGLSCGYEGTARVQTDDDATELYAPLEWSIELRLEATAVVTDYPGTIVHKGILYQPSGVVTATSKVPGCRFEPETATLDAANTVSSFIVGIDPPIFIGYGTVFVPGAKHQCIGWSQSIEAWNFLDIDPPATLTRPVIFGDSPIPPFTSYWNLKPADPSTWK